MLADSHSLTTVTVEAPAAPRSSLKAALSRHPLVGYFALAYAGTWLVTLPIVLSQQGAGLLPYSMPFAILAALFILSSYTGPTLASFVMTGVTEGRPGVRRLLRRYAQWRVGIHWYLLVLFGYPLMELLATVAARGNLPIAALAHNWPLIFTAYLPAVLTFNLITTLGEEPGWRGFALPRLQARFGPLGGSTILGLLHGLWHLPVFFIPAIGFGRVGIGFFVTWIPALIATTVLWTWVFNNTKGSLLIAILLHAASDAAGTFVVYRLLSFTTLSPSAKVAVGLAQFAALILVALVVVAVTRGRLSYSRRPMLKGTQAAGTPANDQ